MIMLKNKKTNKILILSIFSLFFFAFPLKNSSFAYEAQSENYKLNWSTYQEAPQIQSNSDDSIFDLIELAILKNLGTTEGTALILRYIIAGLLVAIALLVSFFTFGRNVTKGVESVGTNSLAKKSIQFMVILNVVMIIILNLSSIVIALAIIKL